jgi:hypothetical protein
MVSFSCLPLVITLVARDQFFSGAECELVISNNNDTVRYQ